MEKDINGLDKMSIHLYAITLLSSTLALCRIPGAKPGRDTLDLEIFGMAGVPDDFQPSDALPEYQEGKLSIAIDALLYLLSHSISFSNKGNKTRHLITLVDGFNVNGSSLAVMRPSSCASD